MGALMPWALWATDLPTPWGLASGFVAMAGTWLEAWRYARRPGCMFVIPADEGPAQVDDAPVEDLQMRRRGPLVQLAWRQQGRRHWRLFWPDTLPQAQARELRLAVRAHCISRSPPAVAP
jgi:toxin CptA